MDDLLQRQIDRLRAASTSAATAEFTPDESLDADYHRACEQAEHGGWAVPSREDWENEHRAWLEQIRNRKQPANRPIENFFVGIKIDEWYERAAIPRPCWPQPGALITPEIQKAHDREMDLYTQANRALDDYIHDTRTRLYEPDFWRATDCNANVQARYAETWQWLQGVWQARGIAAPSDSDIEQWATEYHEQRFNRRKLADPNKDVNNGEST